MPDFNHVEEVKTILGYGARKNLWKVRFGLPNILAAAAELENQIELLAKSAILPGTRTIEPIPMTYKGETWTLAGEKGTYDAELKISFENPQNWAQRNIFELWINIIQQDFTSLRTSPLVYKSSSFTVTHLGNDLEPTRMFRFKGVYPKQVNHLELAAGEGGLLVTDVTFAIDNFELVPV
jgi:hypothetical protein